MTAENPTLENRTASDYVDAERPAERTRTLPRIVFGSRSPAWWGMLVLIMNEAVLFASLIGAYFYTRFNAPAWPPDGIKRPELTIPIILTVILVSSSIAFIYAENGIKHGNQFRLRLGLLIAFLLALTFLGLQIYEYSHTEFSPVTNAFGSLFFTITGLHGLHVTAAALLVIYVQIRAWSGHFDAGSYSAVEVSGLYWHFVDIVWIFVLFTVYLSNYLG